MVKIFDNTDICKEALRSARDLSSQDLKNNKDFIKWFEKINEDSLDKLILFFLYLAILKKASDIHFNPFENHVAVMLRIYGELTEIFNFNINWYDQVLRILKNWSNLASYRIEVPQEGRICVPFDDLTLFVRISFFPTILGEKVVCRVLNFKNNLLKLEELGMNEELLKQYTDVLLNKKGMVVIAGPAGSGKTTTLYATLLWLKDKIENSNNISTIEDPVEFIVEDFNQTQINPTGTLTFPDGLKCLLRQDPNIIAVGEIRDNETALTAMQAGLTGHLIFTTLHASSAKGALKRLEEFGATQSTINMSIIAVLYEKLIPKKCIKCNGKGCQECNNKGNSGLTGEFELLTDFLLR